VYTKNAFIKKFQTHGPGVLNMAHSYVKGYLTVKKEMEEREKQGLEWDPKSTRYLKTSNPQPDTYIDKRLDMMKTNALEFRPILSATLKYAPNEKSAEKSRMVIKMFNETFGKSTAIEKVQSSVLSFCALIENLRAKKGVIMRQPPVRKFHYSGNGRPGHAQSHGRHTQRKREGRRSAETAYNAK